MLLGERREVFAALRPLDAIGQRARFLQVGGLKVDGDQDVRRARIVSCCLN